MSPRASRRSLSQHTGSLPQDGGGRPRVVVVTTSFPSHEGDPSGHFVRAHARSLAAGAEVHVVAPIGAAGDAPLVQPPLVVHPAGGASLFGFPGALARARERPLRLAGALAFAAGVRRRLRELAPFDRLVAHWIFPCAWPLCVGPLSAWPRLDGTPSAARRGEPPSVEPPSAEPPFVEPPFVEPPSVEPPSVEPPFVEPPSVEPPSAESLLAESLLAEPPRWRASVRIDVVAHGADVRAIVAMPAPLRAAIVGALLDRGARFQMVAAHLLDRLAASLPDEVAARLRASSRVEPAPIEMPDVRVAAARLRASLGIAEGERLAVSVGRLVADKRVDLAIAAAAGARLRLAIVGDGPERARLEALARTCGARVTWVGALPREEALAWIAAADVLVHASASEGAPTVVREARALGTRVVACASGDLARWAETDEGIVISAPDAAALASHITAR